MENLNPNESNISTAGTSSCHGDEKIVAPSLVNKKPLILQAMTDINNGVEMLNLILRRGLDRDKIDYEVRDLVHQLSNATNQIMYNASTLRDVYDAIGRPKEVLRFFNFVDGDCVEVSREEYNGEYTTEQEIPY